jgi:predicted phosphodiesterase
MRLAIFGDVHGNLPALEATLADIAQQKPDAVYCLGDLVGYGASPNETGGAPKNCCAEPLTDGADP